MGFSLKEFYCCGNLQSVSLTFEVNQKNHCHNGNTEKDKCCKYKFQYFKVKDNHVSPHNISLSENNYPLLHLYLLPVKKLIYSSLQNTIAYSSNAPPAYGSVPDYIYNCVFRI